MISRISEANVAFAFWKIGNLDCITDCKLRGIQEAMFDMNIVFKQQKPIHFTRA